MKEYKIISSLNAKEFTTCLRNAFKDGWGLVSTVSQSDGKGVGELIAVVDRFNATAFKDLMDKTSQNWQMPIVGVKENVSYEENENIIEKIIPIIVNTALGGTLESVLKNKLDGYENWKIRDIKFVNATEYETNYIIIIYKAQNITVVEYDINQESVSQESKG